MLRMLGCQNLSKTSKMRYTYRYNVDIFKALQRVLDGTQPQTNSSFTRQVWKMVIFLLICSSSFAPRRVVCMGSSKRISIH